MEQRLGAADDPQDAHTSTSLRAGDGGPDNSGATTASAPDGSTKRGCGIVSHGSLRCRLVADRPRPATTRTADAPTGPGRPPSTVEQHYYLLSSIVAPGVAVLSSRPAPVSRTGLDPHGTADSIGRGSTKVVTLASLAQLPPTLARPAEPPFSSRAPYARRAGLSEDGPPIHR